MPFGIRDHHASPPSAPRATTARRLRPPRRQSRRHRPFAGRQPCRRRPQRDGLRRRLLGFPSSLCSSARSPGLASHGPTHRGPPPPRTFLRSGPLTFRRSIPGGSGARMPPAILATPLPRGTSMSRHPPPTETPVPLPAVWSGLSGDLQQRAIRLLAQLAFAQLRRQAQPSTQEIHYGPSTPQPQDSSRPS
jgi:hypothetical protein